LESLAPRLPGKDSHPKPFQLLAGIRSVEVAPKMSQNHKIEYCISVLPPGYEVLRDLLWLKKQSLNYPGPIFYS
jgi:hypothetical protein